MLDCIFCQIVHHQIDSTIVYENDDIVAFEDIDPQAPIHILIVPKRHISTLLELKDHDIHILQQLFAVAQHVVAIKDIEHSGFRLVFNCNPDGGQTIYHLHAHILGGRKMDWPPG
jgi:histidine triad (HIT) family protein